MTVVEKIKQKAKSNIKRIVLAEGTEQRTLKAASIVATEKIADVYLVGNEQEIKKAAKENSVNLDGVNIVDPSVNNKTNEYANKLYELRKQKGMTEESALDLCRNNTLYFATMMVKMGDADGMVAGAINSTGNVLRPALQILKTAPGIKVVSSCMIMETNATEYGDNGALVFGDCAVMPNPTAEELAAIAVSTANSAKQMLGVQPKVAMLSFSTKGSAKHENVDKVVEATRIAKEIAPDLIIDGELQADAALVDSVGKLKSPGSDVAGQANVLVFPDLQAANIGYKLVQRLGKATATGPILQGLAAPVNDLSRGCSVEDIVNVIAITSVIAQNKGE